MSELSDDVKQKIRAYFDKYPSKLAATLPALHVIQESRGCVSHAAMVELAELLEVSPAQLHDTLSFYGFFRDESRPLGRKRVWVCRSLSCMLRGSEELLADVCQRWGIAPGETTPDQAVTLEPAECLGACEGAPCVLVNDELLLHVSADDVDRLREVPI